MRRQGWVSLGAGLVCALWGFLAADAAVPVPKTVGKKVYVHLMPWFETRSTSGTGAWGIHWTMANQNPDVVDGSGRRQIASYYYPLIGPYGSGDRDVIEYQLLLMKYAGVDGVLIDWPGTINAWDYPKNRANTEAIIAQTAAVGLDFAVVYEDHNAQLAYEAGFISDKLGAGRNDMAYLRDRYFNQSNYIRVNNAPLLLVFGPQTFQSAGDWTNVFSPLSQKPTFLTLWYESGEAGANAKGEFAWIYPDFTTGLTHFYNNQPSPLKFGSVYPGFRSFYAAGGWGGPTWEIAHNGLNSFNQTLDLAKNAGSINHFQLNTWNDYGEGTMIEPTREFGYGFLTSLQQKLGVPYSQSELELINTLYQQRKQYAGDGNKQAQLNQAASALFSLDVTGARNILNGGGGGSGVSVTNGGFESGMTGWTTWTPNGTAGAAFTETYNGGHASANHLTHWSGAPFETWTYQSVSGLASGSYKVRAWVRKGGSFALSRLQVKTCGSCAAVFTALGTYGDWTQVETPAISVTGGSLEFGFHTQATTGDTANFIHMDDVSLVKL
ncbi:glycoside hydrolase family 71/99-like protein [Corallococcus carmarthensis]|uniref:Endo-alpha-mannosidase n=1 Tax=Corallococcus carmarthensis TaxID=2316728 RepID=A0A3A8JL45_9BACT|nr:glycoside hydrolase family 71/99-like protein [Corallococcus carmarthensis]NOK21473.1 endo-alpha-mannosidase [Corallococcus carmarthensis]RKG96467.1 endo-alpha-mannosidase [Corallococcus carmarthensis]